MPRSRRSGAFRRLLEARLGGGVPAEDGQQPDAPEDADGVGVVAVVAAALEGVEELVVGDEREELFDGVEGGGVVEFLPGEQGLGDVDMHAVLRGGKGVVA